MRCLMLSGNDGHRDALDSPMVAARDQIMFRRIATLGIALTLLHAFIIVRWCVPRVARAVRGLPDRNPPVLKTLAIGSNVLAFPASLMQFLADDNRPDSALFGLMVSPLWGFGLAFVLQRRRKSYRP